MLRGGLTATLLYGIPVLGILLVLPKNQLGTVTGFVDACRAVFTVYGGSVAPDGTAELHGLGQATAQVAAAGLIIGLFTSGTAWAMGSAARKRWHSPTVRGRHGLESSPATVLRPG